MLTLTCCQDHILTENVWFVCLETSYSGDEMRCHRCGTTDRTTEDRATQPREAGGWVSQFVLYHLRFIVLFLCCNIPFSSKWFLKIYEKVYSIWCHIYLPGVTMNWFMSSSWIHMKLQLPTLYFLILFTFFIYHQNTKCAFKKFEKLPYFLLTINWNQVWPNPCFMICLW